MKDIFWNKHRKFSIRKLKIGIASVTVGLVFVNSVIGMNHVEAALSVEDSNYINETAVNNGSLVEYIRQALATISKAANSTVLPSSIQNLKEKVQALSTKKEADYTESAWQEFQGKLTTAKSVLAEAEKAYNKAVTINPNAQSYETTINELITSYPEYNTVVIRVREGETTETAENRHLTNIRRINQVLTAKYAELKETAQLVKAVLPPVGGDIAAQQLEIINSAENILELNKKEATFAQAQHTDLMAGLLEHHKVTLSNLSNLRGNITSEDQAKIKAFLESHNPSAGETDVFQAFSGALGYKFNNDGTITITYTDDGSSDTVPLSIFAKGGSTQTESPAATYTVTYNYVSGTPDKTLPSNITAPAAVNDKHTGDVVASPSGQTDVEDTANQGTWHFNGWDKASVTVGTSDETVTGTWTFTATPVATYSVTYNYVSGTPDKSLPSNITAPAAVSDKHTGDVVASPSGQTDVEDAANQGTWHFNGWDKQSVTIGTANETVTGTWTFTARPVATYSITYNYVSGTPDKSLPSNITAPAAVSDKHTGDVVASPSGQTDVEDAANQGTWHFNGWDKASVTVGTSDETVTGTWNFVPTPPAATYSVTYTYVSGTPDKTLPSSITAPAVVNDKHTGDVVASPTDQTDVEDAGNQGTWHFNGWDKASVTIGTANEVVTGTWNFVPTPPVATYSVTYNYVSGTPDKTLPSNITAPAVVSDKHTGDVVASPSGQTDVEDTANQGTWHFNGWDKVSVTVGTSDETVTGTWTFTATPEDKPSTTPDTAIPGENPSTTPGTATPGENPSTTPGTATPGENPGTTPGTAIPGENPSPTPGTTTPGENPGTTPGTATPGENPSTTPGTATPGENPSTTPGTATPGENPGTTPGTTTPGENPDTTPGTATPGENPSPTPGTATPGENPGTTPGTATPGENPGTTPGTTTPGENPSPTPGTATPGENPGTTPGTATPGDTPSTTPDTAPSGENPSTTPDTAILGDTPSTTPDTASSGDTPGTTPGTATPGENPGTTPGTATPGENPSTTPGTTTPGENPGTTPGTTTPGENPDTTPGTTTPGENPSTTPGTATPGENPGVTPDTVTPRTTDLYVSGREGNTLSNSVAEEWSEKDSHWFYQLEDNSYIANEWKQINGTWYRFDNSGLMQTGWVKDNGTWYYLNQSGAMQTGWVKDNGTWYYLNQSGAMQTGWIKDKGIWYYLNDSGAMQTGWVKDNGTWYYLNDSGAMQTGWIQDNGTWYYLNDSGAMQTGWVKDNDTWYYLDNSGAMKTGWFTVSGKWYYAYSSGALAVDTTVDGYTVNVNGEWV